MELKFRSANKALRKYQDGGLVPPTEDPNAAPVDGSQEGAAPTGGEDPMMQLIQAAAQALQSQDCNMAMQVLQMLIQLAQGGAQGAEPDTQPVFKMGGQLLRRVKKN